MATDKANQHEAEPIDSASIEAIVASHGGGRSSLIAVLGDIQAQYRYLPEDALRIVAKTIGIPLVEVYAAATFYHSFSLKPKGKHIVQCCLGTACHVRGGAGIAEELEQKLGISKGETTPDGEFSLEAVNCLGACALGPVVVVDGRYYSKVKKSQLTQILEESRNGARQGDPLADARIFALQVSCPHCESSLMDEDHLLHGKPSIRLNAFSNARQGWVRLSGLYGINGAEMQHPVPADTIVDFYCPHCSEALAGDDICLECEAPMVRMSVPGGALLICSSYGCKGHSLDVCPPGEETAGAVNTKTIRKVPGGRG